MSLYTDAIEEYRRLCHYYKVPVQFKDGREDLYGHGKELWARLSKERAGKPYRQIDEWETFDNNAD